MQKIWKKSLFWMMGLMIVLSPVVAVGKSPFVERLESYTENACWFCDVFKTIFTIMNDIVSVTTGSMQNTFLGMLGLFVLFWLLFRVGRTAIDISMNPDTSLVPDILKQIMRTSIAAILLLFYIDFFDYIVSPAIQMGIGLGNRITEKQLMTEVQEAQRVQKDAGAKNSFVDSSSSKLGYCKDYDEAVAREAGEGHRSSDGTESVFRDSTKYAFLCYVETGSVAMMTGMAIGSTAIHAWGEMGWMDKIRHMQLLGVGIELFIIFFILFIQFPLQLFDPLLNLAFVSALMPLWVVLWGVGTKATSKYWQKALDILIGVCVSLIVISIVAVICIELVNNALGDRATRTAMFQALIRGGDTAAIFEGTAKSSGLKGILLGPIGKVTLMTAALGYLAFNLFKKAPSLAGKFGEALDLGGNATAATVVNGAGSLAVRTASAGASATYHGLQGAAERNDGWGTAARWTLGAGSAVAGMATGGLGGAIASNLSAMKGYRYQAPNRTHNGGFWDSLRASQFGQMFGGKTFRKLPDGVRLDTKSGLSTKTNKNSIEKYDRKKGTYTVTDRNNNVLGSYDKTHSMVSVKNGQTYHMEANGMSNGDAIWDNAHGVYTNMINGVEYAYNSRTGSVTAREKDEHGAWRNVVVAAAMENRVVNLGKEMMNDYSEALSIQKTAGQRMMDFEALIAAKGMKT